MRKRFFGLLVTLCMALGLMPAMPVRAEDTHTHCICGATGCTGAGHDDTQTWTAVTDTNENGTIEKAELDRQITAGTSEAPKYYYLTANVSLQELGSAWHPADNTVLCLNGKSITSEDNACIVIQAYYTFTLTDCMNGGKISLTNEDRKHEIVDMYQPSSTFNMYGGSLSDSTNLLYGAVDMASRCTFNMYGGSISGNSLRNTLNTGIVEIPSDGIFNMYGGSITGNTVTDKAGGVYNGGTFNASGNAIVDNNIVSGGAIERNVYLKSNKIININGALGASAKIGVTVDAQENDSLVIADVYTDAMSSTDGKIFSDQTYNVIRDVSNNQIKIKRDCGHSSVVKVNGQAATCAADGWMEYYKCSRCEALFKDENKTEQISNFDDWKAGDGKIDKVSHSWTYSANGDTLSASCSRKATCHEEDKTLTLTASTVEHSGNPYSSATISNTSAWEGAGLATPTIMYEGTDGTSYESSATAPTAASRYKATITVNGKTAAAPFSITGDSHTLKVESGANGTAGIEGRPVTTAAIRQYADVTLTATPSTGYQFKQWSISGASITISNNKFIMPDSDVTVTAEFEKISSNGGGSSSGGSSSGGSSSDSSSSGGSSTTPSTDKDKDNGTKTETTTLPDGTKVETTTKTDETTGTTTVEEKKTAPDGTVQSTLVESNAATGEEFTVTKTESKDGQVSSVLATLKTEDATVTKAKADKAEALANMKNIPFRVKVFDENGKLDYKVRVNTADVKADTTLYVYKYDSKTKTYNIVESEYQKISSDDKANIVCDFEKLSVTQRYEFVAQDRAERIDKKILATVKVKTAQKSVKENQSTTFKMDEKLNMENVSSIKYATTDQKIATVSKSGKITAKGSGTVVIKATVTLLNGKTKTVRMTIKVK